MGVDEAVLVLGDEVDHLVNGDNLVEVKSCIDGGPLVGVLKEQWVNWVQVLLRAIVKQVADGSPVEGHVRHQTLQAQFEENLEEDQGSGLLSYKLGDLCRRLCGVDTLDQQELPQSWLMDFNSVDIIELVLDADSPVVVELAPEMDMVGLLDPQIVASSQSMEHPCLTHIVSDWSRTFHSEVEHIDAILAQDEEVLVLPQEEALDR